MNGKKQNNTALYGILLVGLIAVGAIKGGISATLNEGDLVKAIIPEVIGGALLFGLLAYVVQQVTKSIPDLYDVIERQEEDINNLHTTQEKFLSEPTTRPPTSSPGTPTISTPEPASAPTNTAPPPPTAPPPEEPKKASRKSGLSAKEMMQQMSPTERFSPETVTAAETAIPPTPPAQPKQSPTDTLETQIAQELEASDFSGMFEDYQQERDEAIASGKGFETDDEGFPD